jgi:hypothetical protein
MEPIMYSWERLPEYLAAQEYSRCLGRILASLPPRRARRAARPLTAAAVRLGAAIAGCNADLPPGEELSGEERAEFRRLGLDGLQESRHRLTRLDRRRDGDRTEIARALDLLDRIEMWMTAGPPVRAGASH